jgi:hypothetical protein
MIEFLLGLVPVCPFCKRVHCICGSGPGRPPFAPETSA